MLLENSKSCAWKGKVNMQSPSLPWGRPASPGGPTCHSMLWYNILHTVRACSAPVVPYAHFVSSLQTLFRLVSLFFQLLQMEESIVGVRHGSAMA